MTELELKPMPNSLADNKDQETEVGKDKKLPYPKSVFFVIATEISERFSYYGMRAVLTIYLRNVLNFSDDAATTYYHAFLLMCYGLPVFWGIIADSFLGKFTTIWIVSILFCLGNAILTFSAVPPLHLPQLPLTFIGLILMAFGTAGMKPCVAPFGGDQFTLPQQEKPLQQFFSVFFFAMTLGNMVSTVATPIFRRDVHCFGEESCYSLAFGVPTCIMVFAVVIFCCGKSLYRIKKPEGNVLVQVIGCIYHALFGKKIGNLQPKKEHWLDKAEDKYDAKLIRDVKGLLRVLVYYLPIPMFFALYEQLGSRWTLQATRMNGVVRGYTIKPDQMQVCNAILMFIFIPIFQTVIYPMFAKVNLLKRPLQKMGIGMLLAALSFLSAGLVEQRIQTALYSPLSSYGDLNIINTLPCPVIALIGEDSRELEGEQYFIYHSLKSLNTNTVDVSLRLDESCSIRQSSLTKRTWEGSVPLLAGHLQSIYVYASEGVLMAHSTGVSEDLTKSNEGNALIRVACLPIPSFNESANVYVNLTSGSERRNFALDHKCLWKNSTHSASEIPPSTYSVTYKLDGHNNISGNLEDINLLNGGSYLQLVYPSYDESLKLDALLVVLNPPNSIHMLWLIPQYILMACAEVLFVPSGMEFSFTEAPLSMKSTLQSLWHLMNAFGNLIVIISAQGEHSLSPAYEFFIFSAVMFLDMIIFCFLTMRYTYVTVLPEDDQNGNKPVIIE